MHIVGTHGVPAKYGGFETLAEYLCRHLSEVYDITVYCNYYKYLKKKDFYYGAKLKYVRLEASGLQGIIYDAITYVFACISADVILYLSPVGSGIITPIKFLFRKKVIVNHGGLNEWEREKLNWFKKKWAKCNHYFAAKYSDVNIADNELYKMSLHKNFGAEAIVISYGGDHVKNISVEDEQLVQKYPFVKGKYAVSVSRAQIDNNIHIVLEAFEQYEKCKLVLISNWQVSAYGKMLYEKYKNKRNYILLDAIYDKIELDFIRGNAFIYIHSHSRCGTAPSLLEAMSLSLPIFSFDVPINREVTRNKAIYFSNSEDLINSIKKLDNREIINNKKDMYLIASSNYTWDIVSHQYSSVINELNENQT